MVKIINYNIDMIKIIALLVAVALTTLSKAQMVTIPIDKECTQQCDEVGTAVCF